MVVQATDYSHSQIIEHLLKVNISSLASLDVLHFQAVLRLRVAMHYGGGEVSGAPFPHLLGVPITKCHRNYSVTLYVSLITSLLLTRECTVFDEFRWEETVEVLSGKATYFVVSDTSSIGVLEFLSMLDATEDV